MACLIMALKLGDIPEISNILVSDERNLKEFMPDVVDDSVTLKLASLYVLLYDTSKPVMDWSDLLIVTNAVAGVAAL